VFKQPNAGLMAGARCTQTWRDGWPAKVPASESAVGWSSPVMAPDVVAISLTSLVGRRSIAQVPQVPWDEWWGWTAVRVAALKPHHITDDGKGRS